MASTTWRTRNSLKLVGVLRTAHWLYAVPAKLAGSH
jgi:hypothetical protein